MRVRMFTVSLWASVGCTGLGDVEPPEQDVCKGSADCDSGYHCEKLLCVKDVEEQPKPAGCARNADCADTTTPLCMNGTCVAPCTASPCNLGAMCTVDLSADVGRVCTPAVVPTCATTACAPPLLCHDIDAGAVCVPCSDPAVTCAIGTVCVAGFGTHEASCAEACSDGAPCAGREAACVSVYRADLSLTDVCASCPTGCGDTEVCAADAADFLFQVAPACISATCSGNESCGAQAPYCDGDVCAHPCAAHPCASDKLCAVQLTAADGRLCLSCEQAGGLCPSGKVCVTTPSGATCVDDCTRCHDDNCVSVAGFHGPEDICYRCACGATERCALTHAETFDALEHECRAPECTRSTQCTFGQLCNTEQEVCFDPCAQNPCGDAIFCVVDQASDNQRCAGCDEVGCPGGGVCARTADGAATCLAPCGVGCGVGHVCMEVTGAAAGAVATCILCGCAENETCAAGAVATYDQAHARCEAQICAGADSNCPGPTLTKCHGATCVNPCTEPDFCVGEQCTPDASIFERYLCGTCEDVGFACGAGQVCAQTNTSHHACYPPASTCLGRSVAIVSLAGPNGATVQTCKACPSACEPGKLCQHTYGDTFEAAIVQCRDAQCAPECVAGQTCVPTDAGARCVDRCELGSACSPAHPDDVACVSSSNTTGEWVQACQACDADCTSPQICQANGSSVACLPVGSGTWVERGGSATGYGVSAPVGVSGHQAQKPQLFIDSAGSVHVAYLILNTNPNPDLWQVQLKRFEQSGQWAGLGQSDAFRDYAAITSSTNITSFRLLRASDAHPAVFYPVSGSIYAKRWNGTGWVSVGAGQAFSNMEAWDVAGPIGTRYAVLVVQGSGQYGQRKLLGSLYDEANTAPSYANTTLGTLCETTSVGETRKDIDFVQATVTPTGKLIYGIDVTSGAASCASGLHLREVASLPSGAVSELGTGLTADLSLPKDPKLGLSGSTLLAALRTGSGVEQTIVARLRQDATTWTALGGATGQDVGTSREDPLMVVPTDGFPIVAWRGVDLVTNSYRRIEVRHWNGSGWLDLDGPANVDTEHVVSELALTAGANGAGGQQACVAWKHLGSGMDSYIYVRCHDL